MAAFVQVIIAILQWIVIATAVVVTWIVVNFCRAVIQAIFPHPEFYYRRLL